MTHLTEGNRTKAQKVMLHLLVEEPRKFRNAKEISEFFNINKSTVSSALSKFKNELGILDHDAGGYYRIAPGNELYGWGYYHYGWDAFDAELKQSAKESLLNKQKILAYLEKYNIDIAQTKKN